MKGSSINLSCSLKAKPVTASFTFISMNVARSPRGREHSPKPCPAEAAPEPLLRLHKFLTVEGSQSRVSIADCSVLHTLCSVGGGRSRNGRGRGYS